MVLIVLVSRPEGAPGLPAGHSYGRTARRRAAGRDDAAGRQSRSDGANREGRERLRDRAHRATRLSAVLWRSA